MRETKINFIVQMLNQDVTELPMIEVSKLILEEYFERYPNEIKIIPVNDRYSLCKNFLTAFGIIPYTDEEMLAACHHIYTYRGVMNTEATIKSGTAAVIDVLDMIFNYLGMVLYRTYTSKGELYLEIELPALKDPYIMLQMLEDLLKDLILHWNIGPGGTGSDGSGDGDGDNELPGEGLILRKLEFAIDLDISFSISSPLIIQNNLDILFYHVVDFK